MTWDLRLDPGTRDLVPGIITGPEEIVQRLVTRLKRELGEWFLDTAAGLPWYGDAGGRQPGGRGILGAKPHTKRAIDLLIRREALGTEGVERIVKLNTLFPAGSRIYTLYMEAFITGAGIVPLSISIEALSGGQGGCDVYVHNLLLGRNAANTHPAQSIVFENGMTLQEMFDAGMLQGGGGGDAITVNTISADQHQNIQITYFATQAEYDALIRTGKLINGARYIITDA